MADQPIDPNGQSIDPNAPAQVAQTESPVSRAPPGDQTEQEALASANASAPVTFLEQLRNLCLRSNGETNRYPSLAFKDQFHDRPVAQPGAVVGLPKIVRSGENDIKGDNPVFALDAKIFIQGIEISPFVSGAISVSRTNVNGHSTCTFTITNQADQFIWTEANLRALYGESKPSVQRAVKAQLAGGVATEAATKRADALIAASQVSTFTAAEHLKKKLYGFKANRLVNKRIRDPQGIPFFTRYDLRPNSCIFNKMDPIRVFVKYPYRIGDPSKLGTTELWMPEFCGMVENVSVEEDEVTGVSRITIESADIIHMLLERMRISMDVNIGRFNPEDSLGFISNQVVGNNSGSGTNPTVQNLQTSYSTLTDGFFNRDQPGTVYDDIMFNLYGHPAPDKDLEAAVRELLIFDATNLKSNRSNRGVRNITFGGAFYFDNQNKARGTEQSSRAFLEEYHKFALFGPKRRPWTLDEVNTVGAGTTSVAVDKKGKPVLDPVSGSLLPGVYAPDNACLWSLLPKGGAGPANLVDESHIAVRASHELNWTTRAEVIKNFVSSVDYQMFVAPTGDLLLEFPFADFRPEDFGEFRDAFRVNKVLQNSKFGDMQQDPVSAVVVTTGFVKGGSQTNKDAVDLTKVVAVSPILAARYGVTVAPVQIPFLKFTDTAIAQQRAVIELQKRNSMCNALSFSPSYRPFLLPNRPIHHIKRTRMGTAGTVNYTYDVGSATPSAKCDVGLEYVRVWTGYYRSIEGEALQDIQKRQITASGMTPDQLNILDQPKLAADDIELQVYTTVMAGESIPVSARLGWGPKAVCTPNSGILIIDPKKITVPPEDTGPTAHEAQAANNTQAFTPLELPNIPPQNHKFKSDPTTVLRITSKFGPRQDPKDGSRSFHDGVDFGVAAGTPLYAVDDGKVIIARFDQDSGNHIAILTDDGYRATYCHMTNMELQVGARVSAGQRIGTSGATGRVTGPHLHFIVIPPVGKRSTKDQALNGPDGGAVDPLDVLPLTGVIPAPAATGVS